ncbi:hypothetical protein ACFYPT_38865 [Streptomyces sp. NPDC005529]|uniref:hypothetical protein n=1 Tax=unclassified Streptomyces TaxID=2593676 RepID=UPI00339ECD30
MENYVSTVAQSLQDETSVVAAAADLATAIDIIFPDGGILAGRVAEASAHVVEYATDLQRYTDQQILGSVVQWLEIPWNAYALVFEQADAALQSRKNSLERAQWRAGLAAAKTLRRISLHTMAILGHLRDTGIRARGLTIMCLLCYDESVEPDLVCRPSDKTMQGHVFHAECVLQAVRDRGEAVDLNRADLAICNFQGWCTSNLDSLIAGSSFQEVMEAALADLG